MKQRRKTEELSMDKISVIIPVYKVENYLERCVRSVCNQTYPELEILLIDDGSPDRSGEICDVLAGQDARIRVIHKSNGGLSDARNAGIDASTGDWLAFVDSDDWLDPRMLEIPKIQAEKYGAEIAECSYRNLYKEMVKEETSCSGNVIVATPVEAIEGNLDWKNFKPVAWNKLYRADIVGRIRYPKGKLHEDEFTTHKFYLAAKKIVYVDVSGYNYDRRREGSITAKFSLRNLDACQAYHEKTNAVCHTPELAPIRQKMCDTYCWTLFDCLAKCADAGLSGPELDRTLADAMADRPMLEENGLNQLYRECFRVLEKKGLNACAAYWKGKSGQ